MTQENSYRLLFPESPTPIPIAWVMMFRYKDKTLSFLVAERISGPGKGSFTFPGGKIESGETPQLAAEREVRQETGLVLDGDQFFTPVRPKLFPSAGTLYMAYPFFVYYKDDDTTFTPPQLMEPNIKHGSGFLSPS